MRYVALTLRFIAEHPVWVAFGALGLACAYACFR